MAGVGALLRCLFFLLLVIVGMYVVTSIGIVPFSIAVVSSEIPSIRRAYAYIPASITVSQIELSHGYTCRLACFCDEVNDVKAEACSAMVRRSESMSPLQCKLAPPDNATLICPPTGGAAVCNNGAFCCTSSCNYTCPSASASAASPASPSPNVEACACPCQYCSSACGCCKRVERRLCRLLCKPMDTVRMLLRFTDHHIQPHEVWMTYNYTFGSGAAQRFYEAHAANGSEFLAFYKPSDPGVVKLSRGYSAGGWAYFMMCGALPIFYLSVVLVWLLLSCVAEVCGLVRAGKEKWWCAAWCSWALWVGIVVPFLILVPILQQGYPTLHTRTLLIIFIPFLACLGWLPLILAWYIQLRHLPS